MQRLMLLWCVSLLLAACAPATAPQTAQPEVPAQVAAATEKPRVTQPASQETPVVSAATEPPVVAPTTDTPAAVPTEGPAGTPTRKPVKTELEATDPTTVNLAAGRPQLVEFFAFW